MSFNIFNILIDSRLRDTSKDITPAQYSFKLSEPIYNIKSIKLVHAIYSKNDTNIDKYMLLKVKEFPSNLKFLHNPHNVENIFTYLPFHKSHNDINEYEFTSSTFNSILHLETPLKELNTITVSFLDKDGRLFPIQEHILQFEITTQIKILTPYEILEIDPHKFIKINELIEIFKNKAEKLRNSQDFTQDKYNQLKNAFKTIALNIT